MAREDRHPGMAHVRARLEIAGQDDQGALREETSDIEEAALPAGVGGLLFIRPPPHTRVVCRTAAAVHPLFVCVTGRNRPQLSAAPDHLKRLGQAAC